jgi:formyl-CoA transferase
MVLEGRSAGGQPLRFIASPIAMSGASASLRRGPPRLGEHTDEVLGEARAAS